MQIADHALKGRIHDTFLDGAWRIRHLVDSSTERLFGRVLRRAKTRVIGPNDRELWGQCRLLETAESDRSWAQDGQADLNRVDRQDGLPPRREHQAVESRNLLNRFRG